MLRSSGSLKESRVLVFHGLWQISVFWILEYVGNLRMSVYLLPALISLIFKVLMLVLSVRGRIISTPFMCVMISFGIMNAVELLTFFSFDNYELAELLLRLYYSLILLASLFVVLHSMNVARFENKIVANVLISITLLSALVALFSDVIVSGYYPIGYSITAELGDYYLVFFVYVFVLQISSIAICAFGISRSKKQLDSAKCFYTLMALAPVFLVLFQTALFKLFSISINATGFLPIATTLFMAIVLLTESKHKLSDIRRFLPLSPERHTTHRLMDLLDDYVHNEDRSNVYRELQDNIEYEIVSYSLRRCNSNISQATKMMGLKNRSSLYSLMQRLDISLEDLKVQSKSVDRKF